MSKQPDWVNRGKKIRELIVELQSFEDQDDIEVRISVDDGKTNKPISLVEKHSGYCLLVYAK